MTGITVVIALAIGAVIGVICGYFIGQSDCEDGTLYLYRDNSGKLCTVASFTPETVDRFTDKKKRFLHMDIARLDTPTRENISSNNGE